MTEMQTILAIDDKKENLDVLLDILEDFDVIPVTSGQMALDVLAKEEISLILLDIVMPKMDGFEVCSIVKTKTKTKDIPIIFITAKTDEESIAKAYQAGANDYVSKPLKKLEVIERVKTQLRLKKTIADLDYLASRDSMTGAFNRRKFFELSKPIFEKSESNFFLTMIDIDHFKKINDSYGHDAGDIVIKLVANTISNLLPDNAIFARIGGEEFVCVCIEEVKQKIMDLFESIKYKIEILCADYNGYTIRFTVSCGISQKNKDDKSLDELLKRSDIALYEAKNSGRNRVIFR